MEQQKEKTLVGNFARQYESHPLGGIVGLVADAFTEWLRKEGFEIVSYLSTHDDYERQTRRHFGPQEVPQGIQRGKNNFPRKNRGKKNVLKSKKGA